MNYKTIILLFCLPGLGLAQEHTSEYYPLKKGSTWEYQSMETTLKMRCAGTEKVGDVECIKLESLANGTPIATEHMRIEKDGVYRYKINNIRLQPPLKILQLPPKKGASWKVNTRAVGPGGNNMVFKGNFTQDVIDTKVGGKAYQGVITCKSQGFKFAGQEFVTTYYFAKDVGLIQQEVKIGNNSVKVQLKKYTPAKANK